MEQGREGHMGGNHWILSASQKPAGAACVWCWGTRGCPAVASLSSSAERCLLLLGRILLDLVSWSVERVTS